MANHCLLNARMDNYKSKNQMGYFELHLNNLLSFLLRKEIDNRKRRHWPEERGDFLHFTMTKENMDTHSALCTISRKLGFYFNIKFL
jgi:tRNA(Glu) U13 pseudouridine synthase TruD